MLQETVTPSNIVVVAVPGAAAKLNAYSDLPQHESNRLPDVKPACG